MNRAQTIRRALGTLCAATATIGLTAGPALAATTATTAEAGCSAPLLYQPFTALKDSHFYMPAPGGTFDDPAGDGWQLSGGARIVQTTQPDGTVAGVLDLPSKATAVSPSMCITSDYPTARLWVRNVVGSEGVFFYVSYASNGSWTIPKNTGQFHGDAERVDAVGPDERPAHQHARGGSRSASPSWLAATPAASRSTTSGSTRRCAANPPVVEWRRDEARRHARQPPATGDIRSHR